MNKATYLFLKNLDGYWLGDKSQALQMIEYLFDQAMGTNPGLIFQSNEEMMKVNHELFGNNFWVMLNAIENNELKVS